MMPPLILDATRISNRKCPEQLREDLISTFGQLSLLTTLPDVSAVLSATTGNITKSMHREWRNCLAAELLLRHNTGKPIPDDWLTALSDATPFFDKTTFRQAIITPAACCLFPLATKDADKPGTGLAWSQKGISESRLVADVEQHFWHGDSWQLAAALARQALATENPDIIGELATGWIATGTCLGDRIGSVELRNKLALDTRRRWIIPASLTPPETKPRGQVFRAATIQSAFNIITGQGYQRIEQQKIPCPVDVMHSFVSNARSPVLHVALATKPRNIMLWTSKESQSTAEALRDQLLPEFLRHECKIDIRPIGSDDVAAIEHVIRPLAQHDLRQKIIFNFTSGNMIQRLAFAAIAATYPEILLVYRDRQPDANRMTTLSYETYPPTTCPNAIAAIDETQVSAKELIAYDPGSKELPLEALILKLKPEN